jgi:hypothetical protein
MADEPITEQFSPEDAIRRYLNFLEDPAKLRDEAEVQRRTLAVLEATDPIEKLKALTALERAAAVDEAALRNAFVRHARAWAEENGIGMRAFAELKVPNDVLAEAGFDVPAARPRRSTPTSGTVGEGTRRKSVSSADIREAVMTFPEPFTLAEVMAKVGGSPMTVRKAVEDLVAGGQVERRGPVPGYSGRGRAPIQYARV